MKKKNILLTCILLFSTTSVMATCSKVIKLDEKKDADAIAAGLTAKDWTAAGKKVAGYSMNLGLPAVIYINPNNDIQPLGTILAKVNLDFLTQSRGVPYTANQVLYKCTVSDLNSGFSQLFAMKTYGSIFSVIDQEDTGGNPDVYTTAIPNVGARIKTSNDVAYTSTWQPLPLKDDSVYTFGNNVYVTASAFYGATLELIKTKSKGTVSASEVQHYPTSSDLTKGGPLANIAFYGGNIRSPKIGGNAGNSGDSAGYDATWPGGWSLYGNSALYASAGLCTISDTGTSSTVTIPSISVVDLISGKTSEKNFSLNISCVSHVESSTTKPSTPAVPIIAAGFLVNQPKAVTAAKQLGLTTPAGAITWLLDSNYGTENVAGGVGIRIYNQNNPINLLSTHTTGTGNDGGWYSFSELGATQNEGDLKTSYYFDFTAALEQIPNQKVTIGSVNAQLQLLINVQ